MPSMWQRVLQKLNPVQPIISMEEGSNIGSTQTKLLSISKAYELVEVVNRCINLLVDNSALVNYDVSEPLPFTAQHTNFRKKALSTILNHRPNPYMDINTFRRLIYMDFLIDGNAFIHFDGAGFYHLPACNVEIMPDDKTYVNSYVYNGTHPFKSNEVIHIKDNSTTSLYRGSSRINSNLESLYTREEMINFQKAFFNNGATVGLIVETDEILSKKMKERQELDWVKKFNPTSGSGKPLILDNGAKAKTLSNSNFREMAFNESIEALEEKTCIALGVPPILLNSGNNANIKPNLELLFYVTILPLLRKFESGYEYFFAHDIETSTHRVPALKPDQKDQADRLSSLVNNGILIGNEARTELRLDPIDEESMNTIRIPANIAGSATGVAGQEGGKPANTEE